MAVALSLLASILNGVFVIGIPSEIHYYGIRYIYQFFGILIAVPIVAHVFVAKYQTMLFTSAYQVLAGRPGQWGAKPQRRGKSNGPFTAASLGM